MKPPAIDQRFATFVALAGNGLKVAPELREALRRVFVAGALDALYWAAKDATSPNEVVANLSALMNEARDECEHFLPM